MKIFTMFDFDAGHPAQSDITSYFRVHNHSSFTGIEEYLLQAGTVLYDERELGLSLDLLLINPPSLNNTHRFKVQVTLSDGRILEKETAQLQLI